MTALDLYGRRARIITGTKLLVAGDADSGLRVAFSVERSLKPEPNKAEIRIWNLAETSRKLLEQSEDLPVQIEAGYATPSLLFLGFLRRAYSESDGPDIVTIIGSGDGEKGYKKSRISFSVPRGTPIQAALTQFAAAFGKEFVLPGNIAALTYQFTSGGATFSNGVTVHGNAAFELTQLLNSCGKEWSIQNGALQILDRDKFLLGKAVLLSAETGMIGSPSVTSKGELRAQMLLAPDVAPGRLLQVNSRHAPGLYRIQKCNYVGDTHGGDWTIDIEGKRI